MPLDDENSTRSPIAIVPAAGRRNPAIASSVVVFPEPDGPNSAVIDPAISSWTSRWNPA